MLGAQNILRGFTRFRGDVFVSACLEMVNLNFSVIGTRKFIIKFYKIEKLNMKSTIKMEICKNNVNRNEQLSEQILKKIFCSRVSPERF